MEQNEVRISWRWTDPVWHIRHVACSYIREERILTYQALTYIEEALGKDNGNLAGVNHLSVGNSLVGTLLVFWQNSLPRAQYSSRIWSHHRICCPRSPVPIFKKTLLSHSVIVLQMGHGNFVISKFLLFFEEERDLLLPACFTQPRNFLLNRKKSVRGLLRHCYIRM
jgi:hypothetical protein